jgi:alpha-glucosidase
MAKIADTFWTEARQVPSVRLVPRAPKHVFRGHVQHDVCSTDGVEIFRTTFIPQKGRGPVSYAIDPLATLQWKKSRSQSPAYPLKWRQIAAHRWIFDWQLLTREVCWGLGERYSGLNLRGKVHTLFTTDNDQHLESSDSLYKSIPVLFVLKGAAGYGIFLDSPAAQVWDLDSERNGEASLQLLSRRSFSLYCFAQAPLPKLVQAFTTLTGRHPLPPRWSLGHQQSRWSYPSKSAACNVVREYRKRKIPCDTVVLDIDYMQDYRVFTVSQARFPRFEAMVNDFARDGFRVVTIIDPGVKRTNRDETFREARELGAFCAKSDGTPFVGQVWPGASCLPDFMQQRVRSWWGRKLGVLLSRGVAGIWNDMNEPALFGNQRPLDPKTGELPPDSKQLFLQKVDGKSVGHFEVRSAYGQQMARATFEGLLQARPNERPFVLTRSGYAGIQKYAAVWLGDNVSWFEHLRLSIPMLLNVSVSGVAFCGVDIGGFGGSTDAELLVRWYELGVFYPFCRNHCALNGRPQEPWAFGEPTERHIRKLLRIRYRLLPYFDRLFVEHRETGAPLMRPMAWHYPSDASARELDDQFMLGQDLLIAPILHRGKSRRTVYFPKGDWVRYDNNARIVGGRFCEVEIELGRPPLFVRAGAILPTLGSIEHTGEFDAAPIVFSCYGESARGRYWQDDGKSLAYERGGYNDWQLEYSNRRFKASCVHKGYASPMRLYSFEVAGQQIPLPNWPR